MIGALGLGGERRFALLDAVALRRHAQKSGLTWAAEEAMHGIERARRAWASVEAEAPPLMREAMQEHWRSVPLLRAVAPEGP